MENLKVREVKKEDMEKIVQMLQSISVFRPEDNKLCNIAKCFIENKENYGCVVELNNEVIGFGSIFILNRIRGGRAAIIEDLAVDEFERKKGIGRIIINELLRFAKSKNCFKVSLVTNNKNIKFYEKLGFKQDFISMKINI